MHHDIKSDTLYKMESMLQYTVLLTLGLHQTPPSNPRVGTSVLPKSVTYPEGLVDTQRPAVPNAHPVVSAQSQLSTCEDARPLVVRGSHPQVTWGVSGVNQSARIPHASAGSRTGVRDVHRTGAGLQTVREWGKVSWEEEVGAVLPLPPGPGWNDGDSRASLHSQHVIVV